MKSLLFAVLPLLFASCTATRQADGAARPQAEFFVSPAGSDAAGGSRERPFRTLERARQAVREENVRQHGDIVVWLHGGTYALAETLRLGPADSGMNGHRVVWRACPGETPVISGGRTVDGWLPADPGAKFRIAPVREDFRQLYVNDRKARRTEGPKMTVRWTEAGIALPPHAFDGLENAADLEIVVNTRRWTEQWLPVGGVKEGLLRLKTTVPEKILPRGAALARFANAEAFLCNPGEWLLDRQAGRLRFLPRPGEDMQGAVVEYPVLETLLSLEGSAARPVHHLVFSGLTFRLSNWLQPGRDEGLCSNQANQVPRMPGAVDATGACQVDFDHCAFRQLGGIGLRLGKACRQDRVDRCTFSDIAAGAIQVGSVDPETIRLPAGSPDIVSDIAVRDCLIHDVAQDYHASCAVFAGYVEGCAIEHNEIHSVPYSAISLGWGWTKEPLKAAYTRNNRIVGNRIHHHTLLLADGGGIYCNGYQENGLVAGNFVSDQPRVYAMLYLDDGATDWRVERNVCRQGGAGVAWYLYKGHGNRAKDNFTDTPLVYDRHTGPCTLEGTVAVPPQGPWPAEAQAIMQAAGIRPER